MTLETTSAPVNRQLLTVEIEQIADNPWQPRGELDGIEELAADIAAHGLLQPPLVRRQAGVSQAGDVYQLAFGHRRIAALRQLGWPVVAVELREDLTDERMALIALSENTKRRDLKPIEQYRAWQKALGIDGMTVQKLADSVGLDRSTVSNNLRILQLPELVLQHVDEGSLSAHGAREFLCLMGSDGHFHDEIARSLLSKLTSGTPDWRVGRIRWLLDEYLMRTSVSEWRQLFDGFPGGSHRNPPQFDVAIFKADHGAKVHTFPNDEWGNYSSPETGSPRKESSRDWTCATSAWVTAQSKAKNAAPAPAAKGNGAKATATSAPGPESRSKDFAKTLQQDPVYKGAGIPLTFLKDGRVVWEPELEDDVQEQLGTRAKPALLTQGKGFKAFIDSRDPNYNDAPHYDDGKQRVPAYFPDIEECRKTCKIGATWARYDEKRPLFLWCLNGSHFNEKLAAGKAKVTQQLDARLEKLNAEDAGLYEALSKAWDEESPDLVRLIAAALLHGLQFRALAPEHLAYDDTVELQRFSANALRIAELAQLKASEGRGLIHGDSVDARALMAADPEMAKEVLLRGALALARVDALRPLVDLVLPHDVKTGAGPGESKGAGSRARAGRQVNRAKAGAAS